MYNSAKQLGNIQTPHTATEIESSKKKKKEIFTNKTWYIIWVQKSSKLPRNYQKSRFQINLIQSCKRSASTAPRIPRKPFSQAKANLGPSTSAEVEVNENFHPKMNQCQAWKGSILRGKWIIWTQRSIFRGIIFQLTAAAWQNEPNMNFVWPSSFLSCYFSVKESK